MSLASTLNPPPVNRATALVGGQLVSFVLHQDPGSITRSLEDASALRGTEDGLFVRITEPTPETVFLPA